MFNLEPVGKYHFQVCGTTPCCAARSRSSSRSSASARSARRAHVSGGGKFSWVEVECLGACVNAPMIQINDYYYEDLSIETLEKIIDDFASGKEPAPGTYVKRQTSAPEGPPTSLTDESLYRRLEGEAAGAIPNAPKPPEPALIMRAASIMSGADTQAGRRKEAAGRSLRSKGVAIHRGSSSPMRLTTNWIWLAMGVLAGTGLGFTLPAIITFVRASMEERNRASR